MAPNEVEERIANLSTPWGDRAADMRKLLSTDESREMLALDLLTDKGVERLAGIARGEIEAHRHSEHEAIEAGAVGSGTVEAQDAATSEGMPTPESSEATAHDAAAEVAATETPEA